MHVGVHDDNTFALTTLALRSSIIAFHDQLLNEFAVLLPLEMGYRRILYAENFIEELKLRLRILWYEKHRSRKNNGFSFTFTFQPDTKHVDRAAMSGFEIQH